jgi:hypothetical protein
MPDYFTPKQERMYENIRDTGSSKRVAAMTVNKYRSKHGLTKKKKKEGKAVDSEGVASHVQGTGKAFDVEGPVRARGRSMPRVAGTKQPSPPPRPAAPTPRSSAVGKSVNTVSDVVSSLYNGGTTMKGTFESIFKSHNKAKKNDEVKKAKRHEDEESSDEISKAEGGEELETAEADEESVADASGEVAKGGDEEEGEECFPCRHCGSDITVSDVQEAMTKGEIHRKGVGGSPKGKQKHGEKKPARTAVTEMHGGGTGHNGKPKAGTKTPTRGVHGVPRHNNAGNVGSYAKGFQSPLMTITKSNGPGGDDAIAREIARMNGVPLDEVGLTDEEPAQQETEE